MQAGGCFTGTSALEGRRKPMSGYGASEQAPGADETQQVRRRICPPLPVCTHIACPQPCKRKSPRQEKTCAGLWQPYERRRVCWRVRTATGPARPRWPLFVRRSAKHQPRGERTAATHRRRGSRSRWLSPAWLASRRRDAYRRSLAGPMTLGERATAAFRGGQCDQVTADTSPEDIHGRHVPD